ncbi:MAG: putative bifunctional diguanylate cyclase/phosphodiesterase [Candidatus Baltobacteraceae bacterium]
MRQAIVTYDRHTNKIRHANEAACELLEFDLAALRECAIERVIPDALRIEVSPRPAVARHSDGHEIPIFAQTESLSNVDARMPDLQTLHFWPPRPDRPSMPGTRYARLETLWQLVVERGRSASELADAILHEATSALGMEYGALGFVEDETIVVQYILGELHTGARVPLDASLGAHGLNRGMPFEIQDVATDKKASRNEMVKRFGLRSFVTASFRARGQTWILSLSSREPRPQPLRTEESAYLKLLSDVFTRLLERAQQEEHLSHLAFYDPLTDLPNRSATIARISEALSSARRTNERAALFYLDVDGFKHVNDTYGHSSGDAVLVEIARRMRETLRQNEFIGRVGGDEFAILFPTFEQEPDLVEVAQRLIDAVEKPLKLQQLPERLSASIGIAIFPDDASSREELLAHADAAMYRAKSQTEFRYCWYNDALAGEHASRQELQARLQHSNLENEFLLCYQPIVDAASGKLIAVEALLRWLHPSQGLLSPKSFLELAQTNRLTTLIDSWVVAEAFTQSQRWALGERPPRVHINIARPTWSVLDAIAECIAQRQVDPSFLCVEMGEAAVAHDWELALAIATGLRERGLRVGLDGFGSAGIALKRLTSLPIDFVKLDRDLVGGLFRSEQGATILDATIALAKAFGWEVIAEGVETDKQRRWLEARSVDALQGYGVAHPMTAIDFNNWLEHRLR